MAQERRAKERRKKELQRKISRIIVIVLPLIAVIALIIAIIVTSVLPTAVPVRTIQQQNLIPARKTVQKPIPVRILPTPATVQMMHRTLQIPPSPSRTEIL